MRLEEEVEAWAMTGWPLQSRIAGHTSVAEGEEAEENDGGGGNCTAIISSLARASGLYTITVLPLPVCCK